MLFYLGTRKIRGYVSSQEGTLPETKSLPLKNGGWETILPFWVSAYFRCYVNSQECILVSSVEQFHSPICRSFWTSHASPQQNPDVKVQSDGCIHDNTMVNIVEYGEIGWTMVLVTYGRILYVSYLLSTSSTHTHRKQL